MGNFIIGNTMTPPTHYCCYCKRDTEGDNYALTSNGKRTFPICKTCLDKQLFSKDGHWKNDVEWHHITYFYDNKNYQMVPKQRAQLAIGMVHTQKRDWSCGPNSGLRAFYLCDGGQMHYDCEQFISNCPKLVEKWGDEYDEKTKAAAFGLGVVPLGFDLMLANLGTEQNRKQAIGQVKKALGLLGDVGPTPHMLANYLNTKTSNYAVFVGNYSSEWSCFKDVTNAIQTNRPIIILLVLEENLMHYITVIGIKRDTNKKIDGYVILNTDKRVGYISCHNLRKWMNTECAKYVHLLAGYQGITFKNYVNIQFRHL